MDPDTRTILPHRATLSWTVHPLVSTILACTTGKMGSIRGITKSVSIKELSDIASNNRLLNKNEFESLFPDCDIVTEKLLFIFPKSYIAIRNN
jgi:hypothetical protein